MIAELVLSVLFFVLFFVSLVFITAANGHLIKFHKHDTTIAGAYNKTLTAAIIEWTMVGVGILAIIGVIAIMLFGGAELAAPVEIISDAATAVTGKSSTSKIISSVLNIVLVVGGIALFINGVLSLWSAIEISKSASFADVGDTNSSLGDKHYERAHDAYRDCLWAFVSSLGVLILLIIGQIILLIIHFTKKSKQKKDLLKKEQAEASAKSSAEASLTHMLEMV